MSGSVGGREGVLHVSCGCVHIHMCRGMCLCVVMIVGVVITRLNVGVHNTIQNIPHVGG